METKHKTRYETPEAEVVNVKLGPCILSVPNASAKRQNYEYCDLDGE